MTCTIETNEIEDPVRAGGLDSLSLGLAEYDDEEPERTFRTYKPLKLSHKSEQPIRHLNFNYYLYVTLWQVHRWKETV